MEGESFLNLVPELDTLVYSSYDAFTSRGELELFDADDAGSGGETTDESNFLERFYYGVQALGEQGVIQTRRKNGEVLWVKLHVNRVSVNNNPFFILIVNDITETKLKEQEIIRLNEGLERRVAERTEQLADAHAKVSLLLDSSAQGFLAVDGSLTVEPEYSKACERIFNKPIAGLNIADLLYPANKTQRANLHKNINRVLEEDDEFVQDLYLCLLNDEFTIHQKNIEVEFKYDSSRRVVLIMTDITRRKKLEHKLNHERDRLKFIVSTVQDPKEFFDVVDDFRIYVTEQLGRALASSTPDKEKLDEIFRQIHTFKGGFSQLDFLGLPTVLHQVEQQLKDMQDCEGFDAEKVKKIIDNSHCLEILQEDMEIIESVLGKSFMDNDENVTLDLLQVKRIENYIGEQSPGPVVEEVSDLLRDLLRSRLVNVKNLFRSYPKSTEKLADAFDKRIHPFEITGKDLLVDSSAFSPFTKSLVHVFRNAVDHGIESMDERVAVGKDEVGTLSCHIKTLMDYMVITISDDGRGLDLERVRQTAMDIGLYGAEEAQKLTDKVLSKLIFDDRFTTKTVITSVSGRGVGLSAVMTELKKLRGDVKVTTTAGKGTKFQFVIPYDEDKV